jgi:hypothetical protein
VSTAIEELLGRKNSISSQKTEITAVEIRHTDRSTPLYPEKSALTSPTSGGVDVVHALTKAIELLLVISDYPLNLC